MKWFIHGVMPQEPLLFQRESEGVRHRSVPAIFMIYLKEENIGIIASFFTTSLGRRKEFRERENCQLRLELVLHYLTLMFEQ